MYLTCISLATLHLHVHVHQDMYVHMDEGLNQIKISSAQLIFNNLSRDMQNGCTFFLSLTLYFNHWSLANT